MPLRLASAETPTNPDKHSPSPKPRQLQTRAHSAQPSEPIFFPKLQIHFADFPYLHASSGREAVHLGDLLRIWVRSGTKITLSLRFSRTNTCAPDTARTAVLYGHHLPIAGWSDSREPVPYEEKTTLPRARVSVSEFICVTAHKASHTCVQHGQYPMPGSGILTRFPFGRCGQPLTLTSTDQCRKDTIHTASERLSPIP